MKVLLKGIQTREDAALCLQHGVDGIVVSNHGGRADETLRGTIDCLPEVVEAVGGRIPVFVDGGIRRGTDIFKALALGATAVGIGRPYIWGLGSFGTAGRRARARHPHARAAHRHDADGRARRSPTSRAARSHPL